MLLKVNEMGINKMAGFSVAAPCAQQKVGYFVTKTLGDARSDASSCSSQLVSHSSPSN